MTDTPMLPRDQVFEQAAEWIVRAEDPDFSADEASDLTQWLQSSAENAAAFRELEALWHRIPELPAAAQRWPAAVNDDRPPEPATHRRWRLAGGMAGCAAAAVAAVLLAPFGADPDVQRITTDIGQISEITLDDGSVATLGPSTEVTVAFSDAERRLRLKQGEAHFKVSKDAGRPFIVETDLSTVKVTGTRFNVKEGRDTLQIAVLEGSVKLFDPAASLANASVRALRPGDVAQVTDTPRGSRVRISHAGVERLDRIAGGWREGWLTYENTALAEIVEDLNRYYAPGVTLVGRAVGETRITAAFKASNVMQFVDTLDELFPVSVEKRADGRYLLQGSAGPEPAR